MASTQSFRISKTRLRPNSHPRPARPGFGREHARGAGAERRRGPFGQKGEADSVSSRLRRVGKSLDRRGPHTAPFRRSPPSSGPGRCGALPFLPPLRGGTPPWDAWLGPGRGRQALHVRPQARLSTPAARLPPPPPRGGRVGGASGGGAGGVGGGRGGRGALVKPPGQRG